MNRTARRPGKILKGMIRSLRKLKLFTRLFVVFGLLLVSSIVFVTLFNQSIYASQTEEVYTQYLSVLAQNAAFKLDQERLRFEESVMALIHNEQFLVAAAENEALQGVQGKIFDGQRYERNAGKIRDLLLNAKRRKDGIRALIFLTEQSQYGMASDEMGVSGVYIKDPEQFRQHPIYTGAMDAKGYPLWHDTVSEGSKLFFEGQDTLYGIEGCVTVSYVVYHPDTRTPMGVMVCCISPRYFTQALNEYAGGNGGNTYVVGENGMVEGIDPSLSAPPFLRQRESLLERVFTQHQGSFPMEVEGRTLQVSVGGAPDFPLHIVNLTYRDHILDKVSRIGRINLAIMVLVILAATGVVYLTTVSVTTPVNRLIRSMKRVGAGDFSAVYQAESHDEIGMLCREFDRMVGDTKALIDQVYVAQLRQRELELSQKTAQLDALQMQINPHFLYNTLDMIRWECMYETGGESAASDMIEKFCTLLRMTIKGSRQMETLAESLLHAQTYLEVVNFRHSSKILLETCLPGDIQGYLIPCLSLQPVLENAVRHGFGEDAGRQRRIRVDGALTPEGNLCLHVSDNGKGMTGEELARLRAKLADPQTDGDSIGLKNVNQRCHLCYGSHYGLRIDSQTGQGTVVTLTIPAQMPTDQEG